MKQKASQKENEKTQKQTNSSTQVTQLETQYPCANPLTPIARTSEPSMQSVQRQQLLQMQQQHGNAFTQNFLQQNNPIHSLSTVPEQLQRQDDNEELKFRQVSYDKFVGPVDQDAANCTLSSKLTLILQAHGTKAFNEFSTELLEMKNLASYLYPRIETKDAVFAYGYLTYRPTAKNGQATYLKNEPVPAWWGFGESENEKKLNGHYSGIRTVYHSSQSPYASEELDPKSYDTMLVDNQTSFVFVPVYWDTIRDFENFTPQSTTKNKMVEKYRMMRDPTKLKWLAQYLKKQGIVNLGDDKIANLALTPVNIQGLQACNMYLKGTNDHYFPFRVISLTDKTITYASHDPDDYNDDGYLEESGIPTSEEETESYQKFGSGAAFYKLLS